MTFDGSWFAISTFLFFHFPQSLSLSLCWYLQNIENIVGIEFVGKVKWKATKMRWINIQQFNVQTFEMFSYFFSSNKNIEVYMEANCSKDSTFVLQISLLASTLTVNSMLYTQNEPNHRIKEIKEIQFFPSSILTLGKYYVWYCLCDEDDDDDDDGDVGCSSHSFLHIFGVCLLYVVCAPFLATAVMVASLVHNMNMHALLVIYSCVHDFFFGLFLWNVSHFNGVKEYISTAEIPWRPLHGWLLMLLLWIPLPSRSLSVSSRLLCEHTTLLFSLPFDCMDLHRKVYTQKMNHKHCKKGSIENGTTFYHDIKRKEQKEKWIWKRWHIEYIHIALADTPKRNGNVNFTLLSNIK